MWGFISITETHCPGPSDLQYIESIYDIHFVTLLKVTFRFRMPEVGIFCVYFMFCFVLRQSLAL